MTVLVLDTAARFCSACLYDPAADTVLFALEDDIGRAHAERLMGVVETAMAGAGIGFDALSGIAVTIGPGSFTGIRVGVAAARGFALAWSLPLTGVTTLETLAVQTVREAGPDGSFAVLIEGGRDQIFVQHFASTGEPLDAAHAVPTDGAISALRDDVVLLAGNAAAPAAEHMLRPIPTVIDRPVGTIDAVARASQRFAHPPSPLYLRGADAKPQTGFELPRTGRPRTPA